MLDVVKIASGVFDSEMETFETAMPGNVAKVNEGGTVDVKPLPKVKVPRLTAKQLELFPTL